MHTFFQQWASYGNKYICVVPHHYDQPSTRQINEWQNNLKNLKSGEKAKESQLMQLLNESLHIETGHANCYDSATWTHGPERRYIEVKVQFKQTYTRPPSVHLAMGYLSGNTNKNIYYSLIASDVDNSGFTLLCYKASSASYIRQIRVHWVSFPAN